MNTADFISQIDSELSLLREVRALLAGNGETGRAFSAPKKRFLSAEARERIVAAQRKRWAKQKNRSK